MVSMRNMMSSSHSGSLTITALFDSPPICRHISASLDVPCLTRLVRSWLLNFPSTDTRHCSTVENYSPPRLLYLGDELSSVFHIIENAQIQCKYVAISNQSESHFQTKTLMDHERSRGIGIEELTPALQKIVMLTRKLGISYIFLEALYNVDNLEDPQQTRVRLISINQAFANAHCTFAFNDSSGTQGNSNILRGRTAQDFPCHFNITKRRSLVIQGPRAELTESSLHQMLDDAGDRYDMWTFVARVLSSRILYFEYPVLVFETNGCIASEINPSLQPVNHKMQRVSPSHPSIVDEVKRPRQAFEALSKHSQSCSDLQQHLYWILLVGSLTSIDPKNSPMSALGSLALAQHIFERTNTGTYRHGLWDRYLVFDLLWYIGIGRTRRPLSMEAPTWSWQSVNGKVAQHFMSQSQNHARQKYFNLQKIAQIPEQDITTHDPEFSWIEASHQLNIRCPILRGVDLVQNSSSTSFITIRTAQISVVAEFLPDTLDIEMFGDIFCAEIVRELSFDDQSKTRLQAVWSHGLVLRRLIETGGASVKVTYKRVGRFWMEWPVHKNKYWLTGRTVVTPIFNKNKSQLLRIY
ncbi:hypothetical protein CC86DRAFT_431140 [Ophiobolus disseminans]|uniref:Heterokaryon incompatibility domain-containing protein n=1 Tax=Ophiobolus disseminans TaxID=1469910 RepID=A0A6A7ADM7_9PLEO|nr:hypothetical protein CC86DRAFT_431140 [Ophiobolus disseminans]